MHSACEISSRAVAREIRLIHDSGDSYTQTGFNQSLTQPTPTNPMGNPAYPGWTASNGPNWIDYLTVKYNDSKLLTYNLAYGGATMDSTLVAPWKPEVSSIVDQIKKEWFPAYSSKPKSAPWSSENTIFTVFDGINDVGNSWWKDTSTLNAQIFAVFRGLVDDLYTAGARNFAFLNVPPVDRSPLALTNDAASQAAEKADIAAWNDALVNMTKSLKAAKPDVNIFIIDANQLFTKVLDNPKSFPQTASLKNTTAYCTSYENGTPAENTFTASCGVPVNQYFWLNSLHPTSPMHEVLAEGVALQLRAGPNIC
ncbi:hypothetical protein B0J14DRAFT_323102 [Halenospora varia]|nr:hypothetical protein B0J14DRAFT_323102 [Halenospora varia]